MPLHEKGRTKNIVQPSVLKYVPPVGCSKQLNIKPADMYMRYGAIEVLGGT